MTGPVSCWNLRAKYNRRRYMSSSIRPPFSNSVSRRKSKTRSDIPGLRRLALLIATWTYSRSRAAQVNSRDSAFTLRVDEDGIYPIGELVSAGAVDWPLLGQFFARLEDFFDYRVQRMLSGQPVLLREGLLNFQRDVVFPGTCT